MAPARTRQRLVARARLWRCLVTLSLFIMSAAVGVASTTWPRADAAGDTAAPRLLALTATPATIDTSSANATIIVTARITDDLSGLSNGGAIPISRVEFRGPGGNQIARGYLSQAQRVSGTTLDGVYRTSVIVNRYAEHGAWQATVILTDAVGNTASLTSSQLGAAGFSAGFTQSGAGDNLAPSVVGLSVAPTSIDTSLNAATVTFSARFADALSGVSNGTTAPPSQIVMQGPSGSHRVSATFSQRVSGSSLDGVYSAQANVPRYSEQGTWSVASLTVYDNAGNVRTYGSAELIGGTFTTSFQQTGLGDITAPRVAAFTLDSSVLDTSVGTAALTLRARLTDTGSGVAAGIVDSPSQVTFRSPSGNESFTSSFGNAQLQSGTVFDGWYAATAVLPRGSEQGTWTVATARLVDTAHNASVFDSTEWSALGLPSAFDMRSDGTASAPTNVNVVPGTSATTAIVSWVAPANAGASTITAYTVTVAPTGTTVAVGGSASNATVGGLTVGVSYNFSVHATNAAGAGAASTPSGWFIAGGVPDLTAPQLVDVVMTPIATETTSGPATITIDISVTDDVSGLVDGTQPSVLSSIAFDRPDGSAGPVISVAARQQVTGTAAIGTYEVSVPLPQGSQVGTWPITALTLKDAVGHTSTYTPTDLSALGAATGFVVTPAGTPSAPLAVSATAGDKSANVSWLDPIDDGSSPITGFTVTATPGNTSIDVGPGATSASFAGLRNGTSYTFVVRATNAVGTGVASARSNPVIPGSLDQTAPQLQALAVSPLVLAQSTGAQTVTVSARIIDGVSGITDNAPYSAVLFQTPTGADAGRIDLSVATRVAGDLNDGTYSAALTVAPNAAPGTYPIGAVVLIDRSGNQTTMSPSQLAASGFPVAFTIGGAGPPDAPTNVSATAGDHTATISWIAPASTGSSPLVAYSVVASPGGNSVTVDGSTTSVDVVGLTNGVSYTFTVVAINASASSAPSTPSNAVVPGGPDLSAPVLTSLIASPATVDPRIAPMAVSVTLHITDGGTGLSDVPPSSIFLTSPSGVVSARTFTSAHLVSGDANDGDYVVSLPFTTADEAGLWLIDAVVLNDAAGNAITLDTPLLAPFSQRSFVVAGGRVPGAPTNVGVSAGGGGVSVRWTLPTDPGTSAIVSSTVVEVSSGLTFVVTGNANSLFIANSLLPKNATLSFQVLATNNSGPGPMSIASNGIVSGASGVLPRVCFVLSPWASSGSTSSLRSCGSAGWSSRSRSLRSR